MTIKMSETVRNARLNAIKTAIGSSAILKIRTGAPPANITDADSGLELAIINLPADWMDLASGGSTSKLGTWQDASANDLGIAGHFRLYASDGITQHMQGIITATGGGGDMELDNTNIALAQVITITTFSLTEANA